MSSTQTSTGGKCAACSKVKYELRVRKSKLSGNKMFVCNDCFENKYEPRWLIIVTGQDDVEEVRDYLLNRKYVGAEITATDLLK